MNLLRPLETGNHQTLCGYFHVQYCFLRDMPTKTQRKGTPIYNGNKVPETSPGAVNSSFWARH